MCVCVCVCGVSGLEELNSARGNEVNFVCTEASRSVPRAAGAPPPAPLGTKLFPHLHIYVAWSAQRLKSSPHYPVCSPICVNVWKKKKKSSGKILFWGLFTVCFSSSIIKWEFALLSFDPLFLRLAELLASRAAWRSCFWNENFLKNTNVTAKINSGHSFHACSGDIHTTDHGCYGQGYGWALIPPLISDDHLTATETLWLQRSEDGD